MLQFLPVLVVVAAVLVLVDTSRLGARRGALGGGLLDMGPVAWFFCVLVGSPVALPAYLVVRRRLVALAAAAPTLEPTLEPTVEPSAAAAPPAASPAASRRGGRHRAERPARRVRSPRTSRVDRVAAVEPAAAEPAAVVSAADVPTEAAPVLVPPFAAAASWAAAPEADQDELLTLVELVDDDVPVPTAAFAPVPSFATVPPFATVTPFATDPVVDPADLAPPVGDAVVGAFAPGESAPGPFAAGPSAAGPFAAFAAGGDPYEYAAPAEVAPADDVPAQHTTSPLDAFADLVSNGLMSEAEYERVRARLDPTTV